MPVLLEKGEEGGAQVAVCWKSCGGLGGDARFTMVSRGVSPPSPSTAKADGDSPPPVNSSVFLKKVFRTVVSLVENTKEV